MATIIIKNSTGSGVIPSSLQQGELAINTKDGKLFYGSGSGNIVKEIMKTESNFCQDKHIWLRNTLIKILFSKLLQYDVNLTKDIVRKEEKETEKSRSKKRKSKSKKRKSKSKKEKQSLRKKKRIVTSLPV